MTKQRILVADCEPQVVQGLRQSLVTAGYDVSTASDGLAATRKAMVEQPDLILLDLCMPAGNGHVVAERLQNILATSQIPMICMASSAAAAACPRALAGGFAQCVVKPFDANELLDIVAAELAEVGVLA